MFKEAIEKQQKPDDKYRWPEMTIGHLIGAIMSVHSAQDAKQFYGEYVDYLRTTPDLDSRGAEYVAKVNIGWCFGEGMPESDRIIWRETGATHPFFGSMSINPTPREAITAGITAATREN